MNRETVCPYCETPFEVPEGMIPRTERTCDVEPPSRATTWAVPEDRPSPRLPDWDNDPVIHECRKGKVVKPCEGCGFPAHEPNDECWWVDLGAECPYYARWYQLPGFDPEALCGFGCIDEPECVTGGPWPSDETRIRDGGS